MELNGYLNSSINTKCKIDGNTSCTEEITYWSNGGLSGYKCKDFYKEWHASNDISSETYYVFMLNGDKKAETIYYYDRAFFIYHNVLTANQKEQYTTINEKNTK